MELILIQKMTLKIRRETFTHNKVLLKGGITVTIGYLFKIQHYYFIGTLVLKTSPSAIPSRYR
jgi:hypothetical protein